jgi:hypothetical protein
MKKLSPENPQLKSLFKLKFKFPDIRTIWLKEAPRIWAALFS